MFNPRCPPDLEIINCARIELDGPHFMSLDAYDDTNESFYEEPSISVGCFGGSPSVILRGGGPSIALGETGVNFRFTDQEVGEGTHLRTDSGSDDLESVWFTPRQNREIIAFLQDAESQGKDITIGAVGDYATVVADFEITGFETNFHRLPCAS